MRTLEEIFADIDRDRAARPVYYTFWDMWRSIVDVWKSFMWFVRRDIPHRIKWGHSQKDIWALYYTTAKWIIPRLKSQREWFVATPAIPCCIDGYNLDHSGPLRDEILYQKWMLIQDEIIGAFSLIVWFNDSPQTADEYELEYDKDAKLYIEHGLKLFAEHYWSMWT